MNGSRTCRELRLILLLCICASLSCALDSKRSIHQYTTKVWTSGSSFPGMGVNAIAQTNDGYLWVGTENGLVRFDGSSFRLFDHSNTPSLPVGHILGLLVDSGGVLWVRMESPYLLRYRGGVFEQVLPLIFEGPGLTAMARDRNGDVLVAEAVALARYSPPRYERSVIAQSIGGLAIAIEESSDGRIFAGMRDVGLALIKNGQRFALHGVPDQKVNVLLNGGAGDLWIGTDGGLARLVGGTLGQSGIPPPLARSQILALARDRDSNLWVSTPAGVTRMNPTGEIDFLAVNRGIGLVHSVFEDAEGNLWMGGTEGLMQMRDPPFLSYPGVEGSSVYVDEAGRTWLAANQGGLSWIRGSSEQHTISQAGLDQDVVYSIAGGNGEVWVGRRRGGLTRLRYEDGHLQTQTYTQAEGLTAGGIYAVCRGNDGSVWAGSLNGNVSRLLRGQLTTFTKADGLLGDAVTTILQTQEGTIWVGTIGGLQAFRNGAWKVFGGKDGLPPGRVNSLSEDESGGLWLGTAAGLFYRSAKGAAIVRYAPEVLEGGVFGVAADSKGQIWVASDRKILRLSRTSTEPLIVREFGAADGLASTQLITRDRAISRDQAGRIWLSLKGGLSVVDPGRRFGLPPAFSKIEAVQVDGVPLPGQGARYSADKRRIVFRFIGVSLASPERVRYRYRLDDYDSDWSQPTELREADYTNLAPGKYRFRLLASNGDGLWNGEEASVQFTVEPMIWQTWWFRIGSACTIGAIVIAAFRYRLSRIRAAMNLRFEERLAERTRIAQELHDTLLQGFLSASMQLQVAAEMLPEQSKSRPLVTRTLQLMEQVIEEGRNTVRGLRTAGSSEVPLDMALSRIKEEVGTDDGVNFQLSVEGRRRELHPLLQDEVYRIGREALINAFRHARAANIEVELNYSHDSFRLFVRDDGGGIDEKVLKMGRDGHWGLVGMRERAERIGAQLHVFSRASAGTQIELDVPASVAFRDDGKPPQKWF